MRASEMTHTERRVRLVRNGRNQTLRIPREFEFEGDEAILRKEGDRLKPQPRNVRNIPLSSRTNSSGLSRNT